MIDDVEKIIKVSAEHYGINPELLKAKTRKREVVVARQSAMVMLKEYTDLPLKAIGALFGNRDHSTVIHAATTISDLQDTDRKFKHHFLLLKEVIEKLVLPINNISITPDDIDLELGHLI
jgi:chromosomal replication initiator protein